MTATVVPQHAWFGQQQHHVREDAACNSPHPSPMLGGQHVSRQLLPLKRKRTDSLELPAKSYKRDSALPSFKFEADSVKEPLPVTLQQPCQASVAATVSSSNAVEVAQPATGQLSPSLENQSTTCGQTPPVSAFNSYEAAADGPIAATSSVHLDAPAAQGLTRPEDMKPLDLTSLDKAPAMDETQDTLADAHSRSTPVTKTAVQDRIELFLNTKILLKHKELGTIDTEIAKCQISLEQLRRCRAIPYPGQPSSRMPINNVITGTGPALDSHPGLPRPAQPAPFGVTDGPYSRHYARWLIPDATFDAAPARAPRTSAQTPQAVSGRKTRTLDESVVPKVKRVSTSMFTQLPTQGQLFNDGRNRLIIKNNEGLWVKIVCKKCGKMNAHNIQGFMNHTRIAHSLSYDNHISVVKDCSQDLDSEEAEVVQRQLTLLPEEEEAVQRKKPAAIVQAPVASGRPHLSAMLQGASRQSTPARNMQALLHSQARPPQTDPSTPWVQASEDQESSPSAFVPASSTPSLSRLLQNRGSSFNLERLVTDARQRIDLDGVAPLVADSEAETDSPLTASKLVHDCFNASSAGRPANSSRMPARALLPGLLTSTTAASDIVDSPMEGPTPLSSPFPGPRPASPDRYDSPHISPRAIEDPGMTDDDDEDESNRYSDHADDVSVDANHTNVHVRYADDDVYLHGLSGLDQDMEPCAVAPRADHCFMGLTNDSSFVQPPPEKKKRGRPRKNAPSAV